MSDTFEIVLRNSSGQPQTLQIMEIISVDGRPFLAESIAESQIRELHENILFLSGEVNTIKDLLKLGDN